LSRFAKPAPSDKWTMLLRFCHAAHVRFARCGVFSSRALVWVMKGIGFWLSCLNTPFASRKPRVQSFCSPLYVNSLHRMYCDKTRHALLFAMYTQGRSSLAKSSHSLSLFGIRYRARSVLCFLNHRLSYHTKKTRSVHVHAFDAHLISYTIFPSR
jgi:hypothetical protein